jgi:hypothetical protein
MLWFPIIFLASSMLMLLVFWCIARGMWKSSEENWRKKQ